MHTAGSHKWVRNWGGSVGSPSVAGLFSSPPGRGPRRRTKAGPGVIHWFFRMGSTLTLLFVVGAMLFLLYQRWPVFASGGAIDSKGPPEIRSVLGGVGSEEHVGRKLRVRTGTADDNEASNGAFNGKVARRDKLMLVAGSDGQPCTARRGSEIALKGLKNRIDYAR